MFPDQASTFQIDFYYWLSAILEQINEEKSNRDNNIQDDSIFQPWKYSDNDIKELQLVFEKLLKFHEKKMGYLFPNSFIQKVNDTLAFPVSRIPFLKSTIRSTANYPTLSKYLAGLMYFVVINNLLRQPKTPDNLPYDLLRLLFLVVFTLVLMAAARKTRLDLAYQENKNDTLFQKTMEENCKKLGVTLKKSSISGKYMEHPLLINDNNIYDMSDLVGKEKIPNTNEEIKKVSDNVPMLLIRLGIESGLNSDEMKTLCLHLLKNAENKKNIAFMNFIQINNKVLGLEITPPLSSSTFTILNNQKNVPLKNEENNDEKKFQENKF